jgi:hypothetical protein
MIRLVSERGFCGLTEVEALRRELVQRLAVGDATHSALLKALPPRLQDSKHVQDCLNLVATYRSPSGMQQVVFVLDPAKICAVTYFTLVPPACLRIVCLTDPLKSFAILRSLTASIVAVRLPQLVFTDFYDS